MSAVLLPVLELIPLLLRTLAVAPASGSFLTPALDGILNTAATLVEAGEAGADQLRQLTHHIQNMVTAGAEPTAADWATLTAVSDTAHLRIQGAPKSSP